MRDPRAGHDLGCSRARVLIDAFLTDDLARVDALRLATHLRACAACTAELGGLTRLVELTSAVAVAPAPARDLDERILRSVLDDRARRHAHHSWLADFRTQVIRGTMRTTGTLIATILAVALLGGTFVLAATQFVARLPVFTGQSATIAPVATPTLSIPAAQTVEPTAPASARPSLAASATPAPLVVVSTPVPTEAPVPAASPEPATTAAPEPSPIATAEPLPTPTPGPSPTDKPHRTPPPSAEPTPSP